MGVTKRIYERQIINAKRDIKKYLSKIELILPKEYDERKIIELLELYYEFEMRYIRELCEYYAIKERKLINRGLKSRYSCICYKELLYSVWEFKKIISEKYKKNYRENFNEEYVKEIKNNFSLERYGKTSKRKAKLQRALDKVQNVEPKYLDKLIELYLGKRTTQKDKVYIITELKKYECDKVKDFFSKVADTEINRQLRNEAFYHLQEFGHYTKMRRQKYMRINTRNKKRKKYLKNVYAYEEYYIKEQPEELEYRIFNSKDQKLMHYDIFISHSYKDYNNIQKLIKYLNNNGKNIYCDWINDNNYLKRGLLCEATLNILKERILQSDKILFVRSVDSDKSIWCGAELQYAYNNNLTIQTINVENIKSNNFVFDDYFYASNNDYEAIINDKLKQIIV